jgi:methionine synthase I (cobalamin-dependent)
MSQFLQALRSGRVLLMDGAMGTELQKAGLRDGENATEWNVSHPERVRAVHQVYRDAGAEVFLTNTFTIFLLPYLLKKPSGEDVMGPYHVWRLAFGLLPADAPYRLAAIGPIMDAAATEEFGRPRELFVPHDPSSYHLKGLGGVKPPEAVLLETCSSPRARYALRHFARTDGVPVLLSLAYGRHKRGELTTFSGHTPEWFAERAEQWGVAALGVNCGRDIGLDDIIEIVRRYRAVTDLPLFARPNAGTPIHDGNRWVYPLTPQALAERLPELLEAGVSMIGGCCGTTHKHIAACRPIIDDWNAHRAA